MGGKKYFFGTNYEVNHILLDTSGRIKERDCSEFKEV
jgi:hypothetical protein